MTGRGLASLLLLALAPDAAAHAVFRGASPEPGTSLAEAPREIVLRFSEPVSPLTVRLLDAEGHDAGDAAPAAAVDDTVRLELHSSLPTGRYLVSYRVASGDSHPIGGSFLFSVGVAAPSALEGQPAPTAADAWLRPVRGLRALFTLALLVGAGAGWLLLLLAPGPEVAAEARTLARGSALAGIVVAGLYVGAAGCQLLASALPLGLFERPAWSAGVFSSIGSSAGVGVLGLLAVAVAASRAPAAPRLLLLLGVLLVAGSRALTGHPASLSPRWLLGGAIALHVAALSFWIGSLAVLVRAFGRLPLEVVRPFTERFSRVAVRAVAALALAGVAMSLVHVRSFDALVSTDYGQLLFRKLVLFAGLLGLAAYNKLRLVPRLGAATGARALRASVIAEIALFVAIAAVSAALASTAPPREAAPVAADAVRVQATSGEHTLLVEVRPGDAAVPNEVVFSLSEKQGAAFDSASLDAEISLPAQGVFGLRLEAVKREPGQWVASGVRPLVAGQWRLRVDVLVTDFDKQTFEADIRFR